MRPFRVLAIAILVGLQGCVVPAALNTLERFKSYSVVMARPIDAGHFRVVVAVDHRRGAFNPLGGHGSGYVTSRIAVELWHLSVTDKGIDARKEDALSFDSEDEIAKWRDRRSVELDMARGRISLPQPAEQSRSGITYSQNLRMIPHHKMVRGTVSGRECAVPLPPASTASNAWRGFIASDAGDAFMIVDHIGPARQAMVLSACDASASARAVPFPIEWTLGFSTDPDGSLRTVRGRSAERGVYEVQVYPGPERLTVNEWDLGLGNDYREEPESFMFDERSLRFHWIAVRKEDGAGFALITHDLASGKTVRRLFSLRSS